MLTFKFIVVLLRAPPPTTQSQVNFTEFKLTLQFMQYLSMLLLYQDADFNILSSEETKHLLILTVAETGDPLLFLQFALRINDVSLYLKPEQEREKFPYPAPVIGFSGTGFGWTTTGGGITLLGFPIGPKPGLSLFGVSLNCAAWFKAKRASVTSNNMHSTI